MASRSLGLLRVSSGKVSVSPSEWVLFWRLADGLLLLAIASSLTRSIALKRKV